MKWGALLLGLLVLISIVALTAISFAIPSYNEDVASPSDRIREDQIHIYNDKVVIDLKDATWATYADTNSMDPILDQGANGIEIIPQSPEGLYKGDIVAYESKYVSGLIVHRIADVKEDSKGKYYILKGDNNSQPDPEKVRFDQIKFVLIGIIY